MSLPVYLSSLVRPLITLIFTGAVVYLALTGKISTDFLQGLAAGVINFWFAEKAALAAPTPREE